MKFATKLTLPIVLITFIAVPALGIAVFYLSKNIFQESITAAQYQLTKSTLQEIDRILYKAFQDIKLISRNSFLEEFFEKFEESENRSVGPNAEKSLKKDMDGQRLLTGPWEALTVLDKNGIIFYSSQRNRAQNHINDFPASRVAYFRALRGQPYYSDLFLPEETGRPTIVFSAPITSDTTGRVLGVVVGHFAWPTVLQVLDNLDPRDQIYLFNRNGLTIATPTQHRDQMLAYSLAGTELVKKQFLGERTASGILTLDETIGPVLATVVSQDGRFSYRGSSWGLFLGVPLRVALAPVNQMAINIAILVAVIMTTLAGLFFFIGRRLAQPVEHLTQSVNQFAEGNLDVHAKIETEDEVGLLAGAFNTMTAMIKDRTESLVKINKERQQLAYELKQTNRELEERNVEMEQFTFRVSHDLRAPLVNIKGFAGELGTSVETLNSLMNDVLPRLDKKWRNPVDPIINKDIPESLDFINSSVTRMDQLINAILKLARLEKRVMDFQPLDMNELVQSTLQTLAHQIEKQKIKVTVSNLPRVMADRTSLDQIMGNLLSNAINYLDDKRPGVIEISADSKDLWTVFQVTDNGRGVAEGDQERIFQIFSRSGKQDVSGEGIGLAHVKSLVRRHEGRIWCDSTLGKGTTILFTISNHLSQRNSK